MNGRCLGGWSTNPKVYPIQWFNGCLIGTPAISFWTIHFIGAISTSYLYHKDMYIYIYKSYVYKYKLYVCWNHISIVYIKYASMIVLVYCTCPTKINPPGICSLQNALDFARLCWLFLRVFKTYKHLAVQDATCLRLVTIHCNQWGHG